MIRILIIVVVALSLVWSGYWFLGGRAHRGMVVEQLERAEADGWRISHSGVKLNGFPNRFDTTISELRMESPEGEFVWETPSLQLLTLSYRPNHLIAVLPDKQRFWILGNSVDLTSQGMNASVVVSDPDNLSIERFIFETSQAEFESSTGWKGSVDSALFAVRRSEGDPNEVDIAVRFEPSLLNAEAEEPGNAYNKSDWLIALAAEASLLASREIGLNMCADGYAEIQSADISEFRLSWKESEIDVAGSLAFDSQGAPDGQLDITIAKWRELVAEAESAGLISADNAENISTILSLLAMASADPESVTAPISINDGRVGFAGIHLYNAPMLPPICA